MSINFRLATSRHSVQQSGASCLALSLNAIERALLCLGEPFAEVQNALGSKHIDLARAKHNNPLLDQFVYLGRHTAKAPNSHLARHIATLGEPAEKLHQQPIAHLSPTCHLVENLAKCHLISYIAGM